MEPWKSSSVVVIPSAAVCEIPDRPALPSSLDLERNSGFHPLKRTIYCLVHLIMPFSCPVIVYYELIVFSGSTVVSFKYDLVSCNPIIRTFILS